MLARERVVVRVDAEIGAPAVGMEEERLADCKLDAAAVADDLEPVWRNRSVREGPGGAKLAGDAARCDGGDAGEGAKAGPVRTPRAHRSEARARRPLREVEVVDQRHQDGIDLGIVDGMGVVPIAARIDIDRGADFARAHDVHQAPVVLREPERVAGQDEASRRSGFGLQCAGLRERGCDRLLEKNAQVPGKGEQGERSMQVRGRRDHDAVRLMRFDHPRRIGQELGARERTDAGQRGRVWIGDGDERHVGAPREPDDMLPAEGAGAGDEEAEGRSHRAGITRACSRRR